ncbi:MAG: bifunctional aspartate kinase/diaminopimelate decarboxylase [Pseudomonadota bacterium]
MAPSFVVLKFGGTSVATVESWQTIATQARRCLGEGLRPLVVCSALSGITNALERLLDEALAEHPGDLLQMIAQRHRALARDLGLGEPLPIADDLSSLERLAHGIALIGEVSPRLRARVLAHGELMATRLGVAWMQQQGLTAQWLDARELMTSQHDPLAGERRNLLSASCDDAPDPALAARLADLEADILVTQGFIARDAEGHTVLLGRGGSDTSATLLAARLGAARCEIWTDVPGMYTANPHQIPAALLLPHLDYDEAQELASMGAKVLHPRCLAPARRHGIPLHIRCTTHPDVDGTVIDGSVDPGPGQVKAIAARGQLTLVSMDTMGMWQQVGFLADVFAVFKQLGLSVDLVSTSESNVTVSLDAQANSLEPSVLHDLLGGLGRYCRARTIGPCAAISLVGRNIRGILHHLGPALEVFEEQRIHLVSQAASDLNLTFVVDEDQSERLVRRLHWLLFQDRADDEEGASWRDLFAPRDGKDQVPRWWRRHREQLLDEAGRGTPVYVYDPSSLEQAAQRLLDLGSIDRVFYALKANPHPEILRLFDRLGLGFECVSSGELDHVRAVLPALSADRLLFTPNFAPREEYARALDLGVRVTVDNLHPLRHWPDLFAQRDLFVRVDPGHGQGHHAHVRTAGQHAKFGVALEQLDDLESAVDTCGARVVGLHAHAGSGIRRAESWAETALTLAQLAERFAHLAVIDVGGGLGVVERPGQRALDLAAVDDSLAAVRRAHPRCQLWVEPGRFLVAEAGVLLARVTQTKRKGDVAYVGVDAGMNSLIRPALYGAHHEIVNLSRLGQAVTAPANVVGPICESGDTLGFARRMAACHEGDVLLVATAGAYGHAMSSHYNLRDPAREIVMSL